MEKYNRNVRHPGKDSNVMKVFRRVKTFKRVYENNYIAVTLREVSDKWRR